MKKSLKKKTLGIASSLLMATGIGLTTTSCKTNTFESMFLTVKNGKGLEVTFCDVGASIYSIKYNNQYMTYQPKDKATFIKPDLYYGKALGRIAGRIKDGQLVVDGTTYQLEVNEKKNTDVSKKNNSLHGGTHSLTSKTFKRYTKDSTDKYTVAFNYVSGDKDANYPGVLDVWYIYTLSKTANKLDIDIHATTPYGKTPVNLSNHPYFRLADSGDILNHQLEIPANYRATYDANGGQTVTGTKLVTTQESSGNAPWDFTAKDDAAKKIGKDIKEVEETLDKASGGYDHIWKFNNSTKYVKLYNPDNKILLTVGTDADAVIMYANCFPNSKIQFNNGADIKNAAITIEPYTFFQNNDVSGLLIDPDTPFKRNITYTFETKQ